MIAKKKEALSGMISVRAGDLARVMKQSARIIDREVGIPIMSNVMLDAGRETLSIIAADLDCQFSQSLAADLSLLPVAPFCTTVGGKLLSSIASGFDADAVIVLRLEGASLQVSSGAVSYVLPVLPIEDYPLMIGFEWTVSTECTAFDLAAMIAATAGAVSTDDTRYYLQGMLLHVRGDQWAGVATDGHRLARWQGDVAPEMSDGFEDIIVPTKALAVIAAMIDKIEGVIGLRASATKLEISTDEAVFVTKAVDGTFPDYNRVFPSGNDKQVRFQVLPMIALVKQVSLLSTEKTRAMKLSFAQDMCVLSVTSPENGRAEAQIPIKYDGADFSVGFNAKYLLQMLEKLGGGAAIGSFSDEGGATHWRESETSRADFVLMPLRI